jgi:hypothetical protein
MSRKEALRFFSKAEREARTDGADGLYPDGRPLWLTETGFSPIDMEKWETERREEMWKRIRLRKEGKLPPLPPTPHVPVDLNNLPSPD